MTELKTIEAGHSPLYVLEVQEELARSAGVKTAFAVPVVTRQNGVILALPLGFIKEGILTEGQTAVPEALVGPSSEVSVLAVEEGEGGQEVLSGQEMDVLLVDFNLVVVSSLKDFDPDQDSPPSLSFSEAMPGALPASNSLLAVTLEWISAQAHPGDRMHYYSALEEEEVPETPARGMTPPPKRTKAATPGQKRVTTAALAEQLNSISSSLPAISEQLKLMQAKQQKFEMALQQAPPPTAAPPHKQPFPVGGEVEPDLLRDYMGAVGPSPKVRPQMPVQPQRTMEDFAAEEEPLLMPSEEGFLRQVSPKVDPQNLGQAMIQQSQALTSLVAHMIGQDGMTDLGAASSSTSLSTKGSLKRERLQQELSARNGQFFLAVAQNAFRRLKPTDQVPKDLASFNRKPVFAKYLERQGGYNGQRDMGLVMWMLSQIADQALQGDHKGMMELLALTMVAVEQCAQDNGRWDLAYILSLQEDPPPGVFAGRPAATNPRMRAFGPLCPAPWATTALSYVKEMDIILTRRTELAQAGPQKKTGQRGEEDQTSKHAEPKRRTRFPKKAKAPGGGGDHWEHTLRRASLQDHL